MSPFGTTPSVGAGLSSDHCRRRSGIGRGFRAPSRRASRDHRLLNISHKSVTTVANITPCIPRRSAASGGQPESSGLAIGSSLQYRRRAFMRALIGAQIRPVLPNAPVYHKTDGPDSPKTHNRQHYAHYDLMSVRNNLSPCMRLHDARVSKLRSSAAGGPSPFDAPTRHWRVPRPPSRSVAPSQT